MKVRLYTATQNQDGEHDIITEFIKLGGAFVHLRKPGASKDLYKEWINQLPKSLRPYIIIHEYHELALTYQLGGIHLRTACRLEHEQQSTLESLRQKFPAGTFLLGTAVHTPEELQKLQPYFDYTTVSPVYSSISKKGYHAKTQWNNIPDRVAQIALGGIDADKIYDLKKRGFQQCAIMGAVWKSSAPSLTLRHFFNKIQL